MKDRLKEIRKSSVYGKSQESFANFLGISQSNLASYETGRRTPTDAVIQLICQKCDVNEEWLRTGNGEMKKPISTEYEIITTQIGENDQRAKQAIIDYWKLSDLDKELWWKFVNRFIKGED